jgi:hypothetical protein
VFFVNLPVGIAALIGLSLRLPKTAVASAGIGWISSALRCSPARPPP